MSKCLPTEDFAENVAGDGGDGNIVNNDVSNDNNKGGHGNKNLGFNAEDFANGSGQKAEWGSNGLGMYAEEGANLFGRKTEDFSEDTADKVPLLTEEGANLFGRKTEGFSEDTANNLLIIITPSILEPLD
jgi:hypothetical protein